MAIALFAALVVLVAILGGSSRFDMGQLPPLQLGAWVMLGLLIATRSAAVKPKGLLIIGLTYCGWLVLTLVPLPHDLWTSLPARDAVENAETALGLHSSRPISMAPDRTLNALGLMAVPLAALLAVNGLGEKASKLTMVVIVAMAVVSALLGLIQQATDQLYLYSITNVAKPVGLFANTNHHAVFVTIGLAIAAYLFNRLHLWAKGMAGFAAAILFLSAITSTSRAGFACLLLALAFCAWLFAIKVLRKRAKPVTGAAARRLIIGVCVLAVFAILGLFALAGKVPVVGRILGEDTLADQRFEILPQVWQMARDAFPLGTGLGSFEDVYYGYETAESLRPNYVNMAHNDLVQLIAEGGLVVLLLAAAAIALVIRQMRQRLRADNISDDERTSAGLGVVLFAIVILASALDYPLRTPIFQLTLTMLLALAWMPSITRLSSLR